MEKGASVNSYYFERLSFYFKDVVCCCCCAKVA